MSAPAAAEGASSSVPNATTYNGAKRFCLCKKEINLMSKQTRCKCSKCKWNFCNSDCRKKFKKEHAINCCLDVFMATNKRFFYVFGAWLKSRDDNTNYVGMHVEIQDDHAAEVRATPFNQQSYDILLQKVHGTPVMSKAGYPDFFAVLVSWKRTMVCHELDLVFPMPGKLCTNLAEVGCISLGDSPLFDDKNAGVFIVPPAGAAKGEVRDGWLQSMKDNKERPGIYVRKPYTGFAMWQALVKQ